jgi:hypothetical protein
MTKIWGKKVRVVGLTSHMRLTPPPPKGAPAANQKLFTLTLKTKLSSDIHKTTWKLASIYRDYILCLTKRSVARLSLYPFFLRIRLIVRVFRNRNTPVTGMIPVFLRADMPAALSWKMAITYSFSRTRHSLTRFTRYSS